jgi:hypothetical protein
MYCPRNQTSCYLYHQTTMTSAIATAKCQALGGYVISYGDADEQLQVENFFAVRPTPAAFFRALAAPTVLIGSLRTARL